MVGLSVASAVSLKHQEVILLERHESFGRETSSRSSEVIHASIYYPQDSLKGWLCLEGNEMMYSICRENNIPHKNNGKLIVAVNEEQVRKLPDLLDTAKRNGARAVRIIGVDEIKELEPAVEAKAAIYCPSSGIVDSHSLMQYYEATTVNNGANVVYGAEVISMTKDSGGYIIGLKERQGNYSEFWTKYIINSAGLGASDIAAMAGIDIDRAGYRLNYSKGMYFRVMHNVEAFPKMLIYPFPPGPGFVGIHTTPDMGGGMRLGPYDVWADKIEYSVDESLRQLFFDSCLPFLPYLNIDDLQADYAGIHPKIQKMGEGYRDFIIRHEEDKGLPNLINLIGIESPGLTSSAAIGKYVNNMLDEIISKGK